MRQSGSIAVWLAAVLVAGIVTGCSSGPERVQAARQGNPDRAAQLVEQADRRLAQGNAAQAAEAYRDAIRADARSGAAHHGLGVALYRQGRYASAAGGFRRAAELLPDAPEPRNNLGMLFEEARRFDAAIAHYEAASERAPRSVTIAANLARARIRRGDRDPAVHDLLRLVAERDPRPDWARWAQRTLATFGPFREGADAPAAENRIDPQ